MEPPLLLCGAPRSGTTITLQLLAAHEELGWISQHQHVRPEIPSVSVLNRVYDLPVVGGRLYHQATQGGRLIPEALQDYMLVPVEPWGFWDHFLEHFVLDRGGDDPPRRRTAADVSESEIERMRTATRRYLRAQGKSRFLSKYTDFSRIEYLTQVFPEATFVHVVRDGRAVAASYHQKIVTGEFIGAWEKRTWWMQDWPPEWQNIWNEEYQDPLTFAAFQWGNFVRKLREEAADMLSSERYFEVRYEGIMDQSQSCLGEILRKVGLSQSGSMMSFADRVALENRNYKWRERYTMSEKERLEECMRICLQEM